MNQNKESLSSAWEHLNRYPVCNLATVDASGKPDNRVMGYISMLMDDKAGPEGGIVLVMNTDVHSPKTIQLNGNPDVSITVGQEWPTPTQAAPYILLKGQAKAVKNNDLDKKLREIYFQRFPDAKKLFEEPDRTPTVMIIAIIELLEYISDPTVNPPEGKEAFTFDTSDTYLNSVMGFAFAEL
jgi:general stress protein 26